MFNIKWDPVKDVKKAVKQVTNDIARSDVGKVAGATMAPINAGLRATENVVKGDFNAAKNNLVGGAVALNPVVMASNASSSVENIFRDKTLNKYTLGYFDDIASSGKISARSAQDGVLSHEDTKTLTSYGVKSTAIAGAAYGGAYIASSPTASGFFGSLLSGNLKGAAAELGVPAVLTNFLPDDVSINPGRSPASTYPDTSDPVGGFEPPTSNIAPVLTLATLAIGAIYILRKGF